ncbi:helix-turn-helix domain-containing protein [Mameliella alba]|nr:helix-turn-helix domain-containing protein [Mameliella alba]
MINVTDLPDRIRNRPTTSKRELARHSLRDALNSADWNVTKAARLLGVSRATINRWIASEGLQRPE